MALIRRMASALLLRALAPLVAAFLLGVFSVRSLPPLLLFLLRYRGGAARVRACGRLHDDEETLRASLAGWGRIGARFERACTMVLPPDRSAERLAELTWPGSQHPAGLR